MTRNTKPATTAAGGDAPRDLGSELALMMLEALRTAEPQAPTRAVSEPRDPWRGVSLTPDQTEALQRMGWYQSGWKPSRDNQTVKAKFRWRPGPRELSLKNLRQHEESDKIKMLANYQFWALICARLAQYGRAHIGDIAIVANVLGVERIESSAQFVTQLKSKLGGQRVDKTDDGFVCCKLEERQRLHDVFVQMFDRVMSSVKSKKQPVTAAN